MFDDFYASLEIINRKSYTKFVKNKFPLFEKIPSTSKSSLEKTTGRICFKFLLYEAYVLAFYGKIIFKY